ncbi:unnamed protein product [Ectocarpus fasciculatus]
MHTCTGRVRSTVEGWIDGVAGPIEGWFYDSLETMEGWIDGALGTMEGWFDDAHGTMEGWFDGDLGTIWRWSDGALGTIGSWCSAAFDGVQNAFNPTPTPPSPPPPGLKSPASKSFWRMLFTSEEACCQACAELHTEIQVQRMPTRSFWRKMFATEEACCQGCSDLHREMQPWWKRTWSSIVGKGNEKLPPPVPQAKPPDKRELKPFAGEESDENASMGGPLLSLSLQAGMDSPLLSFLSKLSLVMNFGHAPTPMPPPAKEVKKQGWWSKLAGELKDEIADPT